MKKHGSSSSSASSDHVDANASAVAAGSAGTIKQSQTKKKRGRPKQMVAFDDGDDTEQPIMRKRKRDSDTNTRTLANKTNSVITPPPVDASMESATSLVSSKKSERGNFAQQLHAMITDGDTNQPHVLCWDNNRGDAFIIKERDESLHPLLTRYFRHKKVSLYRQLGNYGFVPSYYPSTGEVCFQREGFTRDSSAAELEGIQRGADQISTQSNKKMKKTPSVVSTNNKGARRGVKSSTTRPRRKAFQNACGVIERVQNDGGAAEMRTKNDADVDVAASKETEDVGVTAEYFSSSSGHEYELASSAEAKDETPESVDKENDDSCTTSFFSPSMNEEEASITESGEEEGHDGKVSSPIKSYNRTRLNNRYFGSTHHAPLQVSCNLILTSKEHYLKERAAARKQPVFSPVKFQDVEENEMSLPNGSDSWQYFLPTRLLENEILGDDLFNLDDAGDQDQDEETEVV